MRLQIAIFLLLLSAPAYLSAATAPNIFVSVAPESPAPEEQVIITIKSYDSSLDGSEITWLLNGKSAASGVGLKSFSTKAPAAGSELRVTARIALPGGPVEKLIIIKPSTMVLLWQADNTYVPPFYKGKALPISESSVKIVAMPEIPKTSPKNLVYAWKKNYTNVPAASGYGKNYYILDNDYLSDKNDVSVTVSTTDSSYSASENVSLRTFEPKILFYKNHPDLGVLWERTLTNGHKIPGEEILFAAPYFLSPEDLRLPSLFWEWSINGTYVPVGPVRKNILPLKADAGTSGTSKIRLEINNKYKLLTSVAKEINIEF